MLSTVSGTAIKFMEQHPHCQIIAVGTSKSRTRLYQIGISNNLEEITNIFEVFGHMNGEWQKFKRGNNYDAFLIRKKK